MWVANGTDASLVDTLNILYPPSLPPSLIHCVLSMKTATRLILKPDTIIKSHGHPPPPIPRNTDGKDNKKYWQEKSNMKAVLLFVMKLMGTGLLVNERNSLKKGLLCQCIVSVFTWGKYETNISTHIISSQFVYHVLNCICLEKNEKIKKLPKFHMFLTNQHAIVIDLFISVISAQ